MNAKDTLKAFLKGFNMRFPSAGRGTAWGRVWGVGGYNVKWNVGRGDNSSVVMAPLQWLQRTFPEAPLVVDRLGTGGKWVEEDTHDLLTLLDKPNDFYSGDLLWRATVGEMVLEGNCYWIKIRGDKGRVTALWWVPSVLIQPMSPKDGSVFISHYEYSPNHGTEKFVILPEDIVHFRWDIDPMDNRLGLSPLASVLREVFADDEAGRFSASLLRNMGVPGLIVAPDGDYEIGDEDMKAAKASLMAQFTGERRGEPFVAGGPTKVMQFGFSPQQMDMRTLRKVPEERVSAVMGVAAIVAGLGAGLDRSTFANFAEAREASYESAMVPLQRLIAADIRRQLLTEFEADVTKVKVRFNLTNVRILQEDQNKITTRKLAELNGGAIMLSEYRSETGRDVDPKMDVYIRPINLTEVRAQDIGKPPPPPPTLAPAKIPPAHDGTTPTNGNGVKPPSSTAPAASLRGRSGYLEKLRKAYEAQSRLQEHYDVLTDHYASMLAVKLYAIFDMAALQVQEAFELYPAIKDNNPIDEAAIAAEVNAIMMTVKLDAVQSQFIQIVQEHYQLTADATVGALNDVFGLNVNLPDMAMRKIIEEGGTHAGLVDLTEQARKSLFDALLEGRSKGEGPDVLARRIRDQVGSGRYKEASTRATVIARTETKYAQNVSALSAYEAANATAVLAFDAQTGHSDPHCEERDGKTFSVADAHKELASEHPNGTLSFSPIF